MSFAPSRARPGTGSTLCSARRGCELTVARGFLAADGIKVMAPLGVFVVDELTYKRVGAASGQELTVECTDRSERITARALAAAVPDRRRHRAGRRDQRRSALRWPARKGSSPRRGRPARWAPRPSSTPARRSDPWPTSAGWRPASATCSPLRRRAISGRKALRRWPAYAGLHLRHGRRGDHDKPVARSSPPTRPTTASSSPARARRRRTPPRGEAWDTNPASPTYRYGPFGAVPILLQLAADHDRRRRPRPSPSHARRDAGQDRAALLGAGRPSRLGSARRRRVQFPGGAGSTYILDAVTIPLTATDVMTATARATLVAS